LRGKDPQVRWQLTYDSLAQALTPARATRLDSHRLLPKLTRDVLVHTWEMFKPPLAVNSETDLQARLLAGLGRDPSWRSQPL
jgi:hypothetical protein